MKTEVILANALKELMSKESLDDITVKRLADMCNIKRQTFYYHFRDIYDLLTWIFLNENIKSKKPLNSWQEAVKLIIKYVSKNKKFIQNTLSSAGRDLFEQFISSFLYSFTLQYFAKIDANQKVSSEDKRFFSTYYVSGISKAIISWVDRGMKESEDALVSHLELVVGKFVDGVIVKYK